MQRTVNSLMGFKMEATDGDIGKVEDFYFHDQVWAVVYLIVKTGNWLSGRKVLISPVALIPGADRSWVFPVDLSREQIKNSPDIDTDKPIFRQQEIALHNYYPWQSYWGTGFYEGGIWGIVRAPPIDTVPVDKPDPESEDDLHLRSTHAITGYQIETTDGQSGHLRDFIIDDQNWHINYLVIELHSWLAGKKVLLDRKHIKEVQWSTSKVLVDITTDMLINSPEFRESDYFYADTGNFIFDGA
jgi:hypothetical protein